MTRVLKLEPQVTYRKQGYGIWTHVGPSVVSDLFFPSCIATIIQYHPMMPIFKFLFLMQFKDYFVKAESRQLFWQLFALTSRSR